MKTLVHPLLSSVKTLACALVVGFSVATLAYGQDAPSAPADVKAGQAKAQMCMACHMADGSRGAPTFPILQGQHAAYLVKQLTDFKAGTRKNPIMNGMAAGLSSEAMRNVAAFYSGLQAKPGVAKDPDSVKLGEKIYRGGIAEKQVPACAACHSPDGAGIPDQFPRVGGQHEDYLTLQLNNFRSGARTNSVPMTDIAARLSDKEIAAVSDYIAGLH